MEQDFQDSLESISRWLAEVHLPKSHSAGLSTDEKKQLLAVNRSIDLLQKQGVPIPDDLRQIKLSLSAKDAETPAETADQNILESLESLIDSLTDLKKQAQVIRSQIKPRKSPSGPKKHYGVGLEDLIEYGYLSTESRLELQWLKHGDVYQGKLRPNGMLSVHTDSGTRLFNSLSTAASELSGSSQNGWKHWRLVEPNGKRTSLAEIRKRYLNE